jgi:hypothetical protein
MAEKLRGDAANGHIRDVTPKEGKELFDKAARYYLDISGDEFIRRWNSGYYDDDPEEVMGVAMLLPFATL